MVVKFPIPKIPKKCYELLNTAMVSLPPNTEIRHPPSAFPHPRSLSTIPTFLLLNTKKLIGWSQQQTQKALLPSTTTIPKAPDSYKFPQLNYLSLPRIKMLANSCALFKLPNLLFYPLHHTFIDHKLRVL